jgi:hypothetical protein
MLYRFALAGWRSKKITPAAHYPAAPTAPHCRSQTVPSRGHQSGNSYSQGYRTITVPRSNPFFIFVPFELILFQPAPFKIKHLAITHSQPCIVLGPNSMKHDFPTAREDVEAHDELKIWERTFVLSPSRWRAVAHAMPLIWTKVAFTKDNRKKIPKTRGLYAFVVLHDSSYFPPHGYLMYVGITGDESSNRNLRLRYGEYLRDKEKGGDRAKIVVMLNKFADDVYFYFVQISDRRRSLSKLEDDLLDVQPYRID